MIKEIWFEIKNFLRQCNKLTLIFAVAMVNQVVGFTPGIPSLILYPIIVFYTLYCLKNFKGLNNVMAVLLAYIPLEIILANPDGAFKSWERYFFYTILMICISPLLLGEKQRERRMQLFQISVYCCVLLGVGSFFARFLGLNYMIVFTEDIVAGVGLFGGLTTHSMLLGPIAGVGAVCMVNYAYRSKKRLYWILSVLCIGSVSFSASRSSLVATLVGVAVTLYKVSGSANRFAKTGLGIILVASLTFPLWNTVLDGVIEKNNNNIEAGSMSSSRDSKWQNRIEEFESSPIIGVGFVSAGSPNSGDFNNGVFENGSSWLSIFSMLGLIGGLITSGILLKCYKIAWVNRNKTSALVIGVMSLFYVHMIAEGYIFFGGSFLCFLLWITVGVAYDIKFLDAK